MPKIKKPIIILVLLSMLTIISFLYIYFLLNVTNSVISSSIKGETQRHEKAVNTLNRLTLGYFKLPKLFESMNGRILILFQNNYELRPSGGFMGSYALINIKKGVVSDYQIQDIYEPDGQIVGHIEAKLPIQQAFKTGEWRLHNANWELDFSESANDILWFFKTAGISDIDTVVAINMGIVQKILSIIGEVDPLDFPENNVDQNNFYQITQKYSEEDFFPGSIKKKSFLSSLANALIERMSHGNFREKLTLFKLITEQLNDGQILIYSNNPKIAEYVAENNYDGKIKPGKDDYLYIVNSNLGSNKADCCIERKFVQEIRTKDNSLSEKLFISYENKSLPPDPQKGKSWGGDYIDYLRIVLPIDSKIESVFVNNKEYLLNNDQTIESLPEISADFSYKTETKDKYQIIGFWVTVALGQKTDAQVNYSRQQTAKNYKLLINKQPGLYNLHHTIIFNGIKSDLILSKWKNYYFPKN